MSIKHWPIHFAKLSLVAMIMLSTDAAKAAAPPFEVFAASDAMRVFEDGYGVVEKASEIRVFGLRNEIISAQCVVEAHEDLGELTVSIGPLVSSGTSAHPGQERSVELRPEHFHCREHAQASQERPHSTGPGLVSRLPERNAAHVRWQGTAQGHLFDDLDSEGRRARRIPRRGRSDRQWGERLLALGSDDLPAHHAR